MIKAYLLDKKEKIEETNWIKSEDKKVRIMINDKQDVSKY